MGFTVEVVWFGIVLQKFDFVSELLSLVREPTVVCIFYYHFQGGWVVQGR